MTTPSILPLDLLRARRAFLTRSGSLLGTAALGSLLEPSLFAAPGATGVVNPLHFKPRAKRVIWLTMAGGPSHLETFDYKPKLGQMHGQPMPESFTKGKQIAQLQGKELVCYGPQHNFKKFGKNDTEICELFPH